MSLLFYTGTQAQVVAAVAQIDLNCGYPNQYTQTWAIPVAAYTPLTFWFAQVPPVQGVIYPNGTSVTQATMIANVTGVVAEPSDPSWWPPLASSKQDQKIQRDQKDQKDEKQPMAVATKATATITSRPTTTTTTTTTITTTSTTATSPALVTKPSSM